VIDAACEQMAEWYYNDRIGDLSTERGNAHDECTWLGWLEYCDRNF